MADFPNDYVLALVQQYLAENGFSAALKSTEEQSGQVFHENHIPLPGQLLKIIAEHATIRDKQANANGKDLSKDEYFLDHPLVSDKEKTSRNFQNIEILKLSEMASGVPLAVRFQAHKDAIALGKSDRTIELYDYRAQIHKAVLTKTNHTAGIIAMEFHPINNNILLTGSMDHSVNLMELTPSAAVGSHTYDHDTTSITRSASLPTENCRILQTFRDHRKYVVKVTFSKSAEYFASASYDGTCCVYQYKSSAPETQTATIHQDLYDGSYKLIHKIDFHRGNVECLEFHPTKALLVVGVRGDHFLHYIDLMSGQDARVNMNANGDNVVSFAPMDVSFSPHGAGYVMVSTDQGRCIIFEGQSHRQVRNLYGGIKDEFFNPRHVWPDWDPNLVFCSSADRLIHMYDIRTANLLSKLGESQSIHTKAIRDLSTHPEEKLIVSCALDRTVALWDLQNY